MSGDKAAAQFVLRALIQGADPETGKALHRGEVVHRPEVIRALVLGLEALGGGAKPFKGFERAGSQRPVKGKRPERAGEGWDKTEDDELRFLFGQRRPVQAIAAELGRTRGAITARLVRLGLVNERSDAREV
jgi:hypothetical protein